MNDQQVPVPQAPVVPTDNQSVQPVAGSPLTPVSSANKEAAPIGQTAEVRMQPTFVEPELQPEVAEAGVETVIELQPNITEEQQLIGVSLAKESVPVQPLSAAFSHMPMTAAKAIEIRKSKLPLTESLRWLAELVIEQLKRAHMQLVN